MIIWSDFPGAPPPGTKLLDSADLSEGGVRQIGLGEKPQRFAAVLARVDGDVRAYVNLCPHFRIPLAVEGRELTVSPGIIWCAFHSAQFRARDGHCIDGPAKGADLTPIPIIEKDGGVFISS